MDPDPGTVELEKLLELLWPAVATADEMPPLLLPVWKAASVAVVLAGVEGVVAFWEEGPEFALMRLVLLAVGSSSTLKFAHSPTDDGESWSRDGTT